MITRKAIFSYIKKKYGVEEDYPFPTAPDFPVLRHPDSRKLFAIIMDVPRNRLGLDGTDRADVINVKLGDPLFVDFITQQAGYFHGYHMSRSNWVSILLDGTVPFKEVCRMIDESYLVTASKQKRQKLRPPKEWIAPANPKYYDIEHAFDEKEELDWKQGAGIKAGDTVFMYVAAPVSAILYKCKVIQTDVPFNYSDQHLTITALMKLKLEKRYPPDSFTFEALKNEYGIFAVRGPRSVPHSLSERLRE